ncbi:Esterase [Fusarium oxysporum f. sp. rapae]|uniref:Esterase n=1 Tax=Fusarium oxysporum f. sp. rapae TaxID=485398 RepID=A0A8J5NQ76_FUSOX|nr:Esterase [Fusarium oxysporum f. sp. rapae]
MTDFNTMFEDTRLTAYLILLKYYVIPRTRLRALISRILGKQEPTLQHMLANATIRWLSSTLSIHQFRALSSGQCDANALLKNCPTLLEEKATSETIVGEDYRGHYLVKYPNPTHIIFYVYGGGFVSGSPGSVMPYLLQLSVELQARGFKADMFVAEYDLAPEYPYPGALRQVVSAYRYIASRNRPIILAGDSAGGNLCLGLLRHLVKPHPSIAPLTETQGETGRVVATCLNSPWVNLQNNGESYRQNANQDCLDKGALDRWRKAYLDGKPLDEYANPIDCLDGWKEVLPQNTLLVAGDLELFVADIQKLAQNSGYNSLEMHVEPKKGHVWSLVDFGGTQPGLPAARGGQEEDHAYSGIHLQADWIVDRCGV